MSRVFCDCRFLAVLFFSSFVLFTGAGANACEAKCDGNGEVKVNVRDQCMCLGSNCFRIGIGPSPEYTTEGHGRLGRAQGALYQTKAYATTDFDNDALDTGIPENTAVGKWIHKPANCVMAETYRTKGCIAVPCEHWKEVKDSFGKSLDVCGTGIQSRSRSRPDPRQGPTDGVMERNDDGMETPISRPEGNSGGSQ